MKKLVLIALLPLLVPACDRGPEEVPPQVREARRMATRANCLGNQLLQRAEDNVQTLELALTAEGPAPSAGSGVLAFAQAYRQHAALRAAQFAQIDSARNHSRTAADSLRHLQAAERFAIRSPEAGTVEANVLRSYERDFQALASDADHPCNWDLDEGSTEP